MASTLRTPVLLLPSSRLSPSPVESPRALVSFSSTKQCALQLKVSRLPVKQSLRFPTFVPFSASGETADTKEADEVIAGEDSEDESSKENAVNGDDIAETEGKTASLFMASLQSYKEALANDDQSTVAELEAFLHSIEDEKNSLGNKIYSCRTRGLSSLN
ncbi:uncharacterized protein A4U43_C01F34190 [Asparagus officinalis]|uniref:Uncharacterized protein n=1 Tax=Asparagus officinalis TaxID=4686 RepID=A0A5P1FXM5_ASPOF|nr:uncharacterized protein A4U43_C01F34190 [Asparagus officinalis]